VPGTYHLKLTADGKSYESTVELKEDPRLHVSEADLEKQYQFVTQINGRISLGHQTINDIRGLRKQLQDLRDRLPKTPENKPVLDAADALDKR